MSITYEPKANIGDRLKVKQPETSFHLPAGLRDGDEVTVVGEWDHGSYTVEKDGQQFRIVSQCIDVPSLPWPPRQQRRRRRWVF